MRAALALVALTGCGRIAFDAVDGDAAQPGDDGTVAPAMLCGGARTPMVDIPGNPDLVAAATSSGLLTAWSDRDQASEPFKAVFGRDGALVSAPTEIALLSSDGLGVLAVFATRVILQSGLGLNQTLVQADLDFGNVRAYETGTGIMGRDCVVQSVAGDGMAVIADGAELHVGYIEAEVVGPQDPFDTGETVTELACHGATDHNHIIYRTPGADCIAMTASPTPTSPTLGEMTMFGGDCNHPRATLVDASVDSGALVWKQGTGEIMLSYAQPLPDPAIELGSGGERPRIASDGTRMWVTWTDVASGKLRVAYLLPRGTPVIADTPVRPAGDEAYELVRDGSSVFLVALEADAIAIHELCAGE